MVKAGFILLAIALIIILLTAAFHISGKAFSDIKKQKRFKIIATIILIAWSVYISTISSTGIFTTPTNPPRIPLLLVLPAFAFFIYFFTSRKFKPIIENTPPSWVVYLQSFRIIVELLIWGSVVNGIFPKEGSFEGYNFDIVIGITAPLVAYFSIAGRAIKNKTLLLAWNVAGLTTLSIVVSIFIGHAYFYTLLGQQESILAKGFGRFPYTLLAGFFMPLAVFMHIYSIVKAIRLK